MSQLEISVIGVHLVTTSERGFEEAVALMWGAGLSGGELEMARRRTLEHFDGLRLIEVEISPPSAAFDWGDFTQAIPSVARSNLAGAIRGGVGCRRKRSMGVLSTRCQRGRSATDSSRRTHASERHATSVLLEQEEL